MANIDKTHFLILSILVYLISHPTITYGQYERPELLISTSGSTGDFHKIVDLYNNGNANVIVGKRVNNIGYRMVTYDKLQDISTAQYFDLPVLNEFNLSVNFNDLDGDGDFDIWKWIKEERRIYIFENRGIDQPFELTKEIAFQNIENYVLLYDMNNDGKLDFVTRDKSPSGPYLKIYFNIDNLEFEETFVQTFEENSFKIADYNNDGKPDIYSASPSFSYDFDLTIYVNDGSATAFEKEELLLNNFAMFSSYVINDINHDGISDVVNYSNERILWYDGANFFARREIPLQNIKESTYFNFELTDINNDQFTDFILKADDAIYFITSNNSSIIDSMTVCAVDFENAFFRNASDHLFDFDGNGDLEFYNEFTGELLKWEHEQKEYLPFKQISAGYPQFYRSKFIDFDADGDLDVLNTEYNFSLFENIGTEDEMIINNFPLFKIPYDSIVGNPDSIWSKTIHLQGNKLHSFFSFRDTTLTSYFTIDIGPNGFENYENVFIDTINWSHIKILDINADGFMDMSYLDKKQDQWMQQIGNESGFGSPELIAQKRSTNPTQLSFFDTDGDGDKDYYVLIDRTLYYLENTGQPNTDTIPLISNLWYYPSLYIEDMNNDGLLDLTYSYPSNIHTYLNKGDGSYDKTTGDYEIGLAHDFNADGSTDFVAQRKGIIYLNPLSEDFSSPDDFKEFRYFDNLCTEVAYSDGCIFLSWHGVKDINQNGKWDIIATRSEMYAFMDIDNLPIISSTTDETINEFSTLEIFPNPATSTLNIQNKVNWKGGMKCSVFDQNGKLILSEEFQTSTIRLDVEGVHTGLYFLHCEWNGISERQKVMIIND